MPSGSKQRLHDTHLAFLTFPDLNFGTISGSLIKALLIEIRSADPFSSRSLITESDLMPPTRITGMFTALFMALEQSLKYASFAGLLIAVLIVTPPASPIPPLTSIAQTPAFSRIFAISTAWKISSPSSAF